MLGLVDIHTQKEGILIPTSHCTQKSIPRLIIDPMWKTNNKKGMGQHLHNCEAKLF